MGYSSYSFDNRELRSASKGYNNITVNNLKDFGQNIERKAHEKMLPFNLNGKIKCMDSEQHPNTLPIQIYLDVTGSMRSIPVMFIKDGLPKMISGLIQKGIKDPSILFACIGDHECDKFPLQLGQFESGDEELDMWLERSFVEGGGGGNKGESYLLSWFNAANFIFTDLWEKRKQKGFIFTIGDEPTLLNISGNAIKEIYKNNIDEVKSSYSAKELYKEASKYNNIYHIHVKHNKDRITNIGDIIGQNLLTVTSHEEIPELIYNTINSNFSTNEENMELSNDKIKITL